LVYFGNVTLNSISDNCPGDLDKAMLRVGTGYQFSLGGHWTLAPEVQVDFVSGGAKVYVFALALGYGF
jgi:hypothetical protein